MTFSTIFSTAERKKPALIFFSLDHRAGRAFLWQEYQGRVARAQQMQDLEFAHRLLLLAAPTPSEGLMGGRAHTTTHQERALAAAARELELMRLKHAGHSVAEERGDRHSAAATRVGGAASRGRRSALRTMTASTNVLMPPPTPSELVLTRGDFLVSRNSADILHADLVASLHAVAAAEDVAASPPPCSLPGLSSTARRGFLHYLSPLKASSASQASNAKRWRAESAVTLPTTLIGDADQLELLEELTHLDSPILASNLMTPSEKILSMSPTRRYGSGVQV